MADLQTPFSGLFDAGQVRLAELGEALLAAEAEVLPTRDLELAITDLFMGLEALATEADPGRREVLAGRLGETYGLLAVGIDPFLRASLPVLPAEGTRVRYKVLALNGGLLLLNGNKLAGIGASLTTNPL